MAKQVHSVTATSLPIAFFCRGYHTRVNGRRCLGFFWVSYYTIHTGVISFLALLGQVGVFYGNRRLHLPWFLYVLGRDWVLGFLGLFFFFFFFFFFFLFSGLVSNIKAFIGVFII